MNGKIETIMAAGGEMHVFYKCPYCCAGEKEIVIRLGGAERSHFVHAMLRDGGMRTDCGSCGREILLPADAYVRRALKMCDELDPSASPKKPWWRFW